MKKEIKKKWKGRNVRLSDVAYSRIKSFCDERGYKIGAFVENAAFKRMLLEAGKA